MLAQSHAEIIPTLSLILVPAIKTAGEGKKKKKVVGHSEQKEHLNWSSYLYSNMCIPITFLPSQMLRCLSPRKFCLHSAVFGSSYGKVCTSVKSQANYKLIQNQE